jgi:hypothetical protein
MPALRLAVCLQERDEVGGLVEPAVRGSKTSIPLPTAVLLGDTGGFEQGGPSSGSPSYANYWTSDFAAVAKDAVKYEG